MPGRPRLAEVVVVVAVALPGRLVEAARAEVVEEAHQVEVAVVEAVVVVVAVVVLVHRVAADLQVVVVVVVVAADQVEVVAQVGPRVVYQVAALRYSMLSLSLCQLRLWMRILKISELNKARASLVN